jgi:hypothetical protein
VRFRAPLTLATAASQVLNSAKSIQRSLQLRTQVDMFLQRIRRDDD